MLGMGISQFHIPGRGADRGWAGGLGAGVAPASRGLPPGLDAWPHGDAKSSARPTLPTENPFPAQSCPQLHGSGRAHRSHLPCRALLCPAVPAACPGRIRGHRSYHGSRTAHAAIRPPLLLHVGKPRQGAWCKRRGWVKAWRSHGHKTSSPAEPCAVLEHPSGRAGVWGLGTVAMPDPFQGPQQPGDCPGDIPPPRLC